MNRNPAWISDGSGNPFYARKTLRIEKTLIRATAHVCGLGQFIFYVNGQKIGDHELDPAWTDYRKQVQYVSFEIAQYLRPGENVLGAEVGNGWFLKNDQHYTFRFPDFMPPNPNPYRPFGKSLMLALEVSLRYADGTEETVTAEEDVRVCTHPVSQSNVYGSETTDHRLDQPGWAEPGFPAGGWKKAIRIAEEDVPAGELAEQQIPPVKVIRTAEAVRLRNVSGREIYDLGENIAGILAAEAMGSPGDVIRIYPAEKLNAQGDADQEAKGWTTVDTVITWILGGENVWESFRMKFTYLGGRFLAVEKPEGVRIRNLRADVITGAWQRAGSFTCDDERLNQILRMVERTAEANLLSVHTDCPTIERFAWQEVNHLMAPSVFFLKNGRKLWEKYLTDMRLAQHTAEDFFLDLDGNRFYPGEGLVPSQAPCYLPNVLPVPGMGSFYDTAAWGSSIILAVRWHYLFYGDLQIVRDNYDAGVRYLAHLKTRMTPEGFLCHGLGDWGHPEGLEARENVETALLYADAATLAWLAGELGKREDQRKWADFAAEVKENYNARLLAKDADGRWFYRIWETEKASQTCEAMPLYWGLVPEEAREDVAACLRRIVEEKQALIAGEVGLPYVISALSDHGMNDLIAAAILREEHPSYYAFIRSGMTTLGEYWEENPRSHCHDMMGHIAEWFYRGIAGIHVLEPGFRRVRITPFMPESVSRFACSYPAPLGEIRVRGKRVHGIPEFEIEVPEGIRREESI